MINDVETLLGAFLFVFVLLHSLASIAAFICVCFRAKWMPWHKKLAFSLAFELFFYLPFRFWLLKDCQPGVTYEEFLEIIKHEIRYRIVAHKTENPLRRTDLTQPEFVVNYDVRKVNFYCGKPVSIGEVVSPCSNSLDKVKDTCILMELATRHPILDYNDYEHKS